MTEKAANRKEKSRRLRERIALTLPVKVYCRESLEHSWTEMSRLVDVTPFGARLRIKRPTEIGRLLLLTMAMPRQLRCFDHVEDQYKVWSLVRNVKLLDAQTSGAALVEIGVAFVGKRPPRSFELDPGRRFEIAESSTEAAMWNVREEARQVLSQVSGSDRRKETRHTIPVEVLIEVFDDKAESAASEKTVTENISRQGAAVFTSLDIAPGQFVKISSEQHGVRALAVVRGRRVGPDGIARLHLEFVGSEWPL
ncbi:MAG: PilZ domain-containing protein [Acidobacteriota bacterium]